MFVDFERRGKKINEKDIEYLESALKINLPNDYKTFLLEYNGGRPNKNIIEILEGTNDTIIQTIYSIEELLETYHIFKGRVPDDLLSIAVDDFGNQICLNIENYKIYFWDHELEFEEVNSAVSFVADSFISFIEMIIPDE